MLNKIKIFLDTHSIGQIFHLGHKKVVWKKVTEIKPGQKIAVVNNNKSDWDEIISIKKIPRQKVYDIEVQGTHNFVGNGIIAHNTKLDGLSLTPDGQVTVDYNVSPEVLASLGYDGTKNEIENTFEGGNFFSEVPTEKDILNAIPKLFLRIGQYRLGILGAAGNHFLDLMKITEIQDSEIAKKFGLVEGQYIFLLHTGSGLLGQYASYLYTPKRKEHLSQKVILEIGKFLFKTDYRKELKELWKKIEAFKDRQEFFAYDDASVEGKLFITSHNAAANQGYANRSILTHQLDMSIEKALGKNPELDMLYDMPHVFVHREKNHFGKDVWAHRNGTVRANGPARMNHPLFSQTGEPVFIPSSMSTPAYICAATDENSSTFFSASHGTGRRKNPETDIPEDKDGLFDKMKARQVKLFNAKSKGVVMQDSAYYKDVEEVITGMEENKIVKAVAKMQPVAVLMY